MGKAKKIDGIESINEPVQIKSSMLTLREFALVNQYSKELPEAPTKTVLVRADAIDVVEPWETTVRWEFNPTAPEPASIYHRIYRTHVYWSPAGTIDCVKISIAGQGEKIVEGTVEYIKQLIDEAEAE